MLALFIPPRLFAEPHTHSVSINFALLDLMYHTSYLYQFTLTYSSKHIHVVLFALFVARLHWPLYVDGRKSPSSFVPVPCPVLAGLSNHYPLFPTVWPDVITPLAYRTEIVLLFYFGRLYY